jgi:hypothetical protein
MSTNQFLKRNAVSNKRNRRVIVGSRVRRGPGGRLLNTSLSLRNRSRHESRGSKQPYKMVNSHSVDLGEYDPPIVYPHNLSVSPSKIIKHESKIAISHGPKEDQFSDYLFEKQKRKHIE